MGQSPFAKRPPARDSEAARRRSTRVDYITPIVLAGRDAQGVTFREETETRTVNLHGAKVRTRRQVLVGMQVSLENPANGLSAKAICVWVGETPPGERAHEIALQLLAPLNLWGLENPPEDWQVPQAAAPAPRLMPREPPPPSPKPPAPPSEAERRVAQVIDAAFQNLEGRIEAMARQRLAEFERRLQDLVAKTEARLSERSDQVFIDLDAAVQTFRSDLEDQHRACKEEAVAAAEQALKSSLAKPSSAATTPSSPPPVSKATDPPSQG